MWRRGGYILVTAIKMFAEGLESSSRGEKLPKVLDQDKEYREQLKRYGDLIVLAHAKLELIAEEQAQSSNAHKQKYKDEDVRADTSRARRTERLRESLQVFGFESPPANEDELNAAYTESRMTWPKGALRELNRHYDIVLAAIG